MPNSRSTRSRGRVGVLTNSLEATDVAAVHAGYAKRHRPLLEAGVALFELKRAGSVSEPGEKERMSLGSGGSGSASSLHAKTFSIDRSRIFIGSFNFAPRSARLQHRDGIRDGLDVAGACDLLRVQRSAISSGCRRPAAIAAHARVTVVIGCGVPFGERIASRDAQPRL